MFMNKAQRQLNFVKVVFGSTHIEDCFYVMFCLVIGVKGKIYQ
jgi:hypothetical protein